MGACHSKDKNKKEGDVIKANDPNKKEDDKKTKDKEEENKDENKKNEEEKNENENENDKDKDKEKKEEEEKKKEKENDSDSSSDDDSPKPKFEEINVKYILKGEEKYSKKYSTLVRIATLFDILYEKENKYSDYDLLTSEMVSLKSHLNDRICKVFPDNEEIELNLFYMGLEISDDIIKDKENTTTLIGTLLFDISDNLGLVLYNKYNKNITCTLLKDEENNLKDLNVFSQLSSFCNGGNMLYISGGEAKNSLSESPFLNDFYCINLLDLKKSHKLPNLNEPRAWHSMIYIPPKYIFIVSGTTNTVELFNAEKNEILVDSMLNEKRCESTLICINNAILFAFCGFVIGDSFLSTIEKCNLRQSKRLWTYVSYQTIDNIIFEECYYVASYFSETSIILFGNSESQKKSFQNIMFDLEDEDNPTISLFQSEIKISDVCPEKYFHSISGGCSLLFPLISGEVAMYKIDENLKLSREEYPGILDQIS